MRQMRFFCFLILLSVFSTITIAQVSQEWVQRFTSDSLRDERVYDMFIDNDGNVYVTGSQREGSFPFQNKIEAVTIKYNSQGEQQWIQNYVAEDNNGAFTRAIYVDASGNVYVTGETAIYSGGLNKMLVIKYSPEGTQLWSYVFAYGSNYNGGYDIVADLTGNVYVVGEYATNVITYNNISLVKFSPEGALVNQTFYNSGSEGGRKIGIDGAGKIIVGGYINDNDSLSFIVLKYEPNLDFVWAARYGKGVGNQNKIDMVIDNNSNIILTGTNSITIDYLTVKFDPSGSVLWSKQYNSTAGWEVACAVVKDNLGNVYVSGAAGTSGLPFSYKITTVKYSSAGEELWVSAYDGNGIGTDGYSGYDIAIDDEANLYVIGHTYANSDIVTVKYDTNGLFKWAIIFNGPTNNSTDVPVAIGVDNNKNVFAVGNSDDNNFTTGNDIVIIKYLQAPTHVQEEIKSPDSYLLEQNFPNPFSSKGRYGSEGNPTTRIRYQVPAAGSSYGQISLKVYDILGNEVATLVNEFKEPGVYEVEFQSTIGSQQLASGVYIYRLQAGAFSSTKKMLLLR